MTGQAGPVPTLLVVLGPTGARKSEVALELARVLSAEIVGCDAFQVYRGLDAATGKPSAKSRREVPHHLVDCVDPRTDFSMADYVRAADRAIEGIVGRARVPIVVGGNGLYLRGLLRGFIEGPGRDPELRARLHRIIDRGGSGRLWSWLERHDPESAKRLPPADTQRVIRAIELVRAEGAPWSERLRQSGTWGSGRERYGTLKVGLDREREAHGKWLDRRVDGFFDAGVADEVERLLGEGVPREANAFKAIGYREILGALERGAPARSVMNDVRHNTRRYAKRQRTWFRAEPDVVWLDAAEEPRRIAGRILELWDRIGPNRPLPE